MKKHALLLSCLLVFAVYAQAKQASTRNNWRSEYPQYNLEIVLDPDQHRIEGRCTLLIPPTKESRASINLELGKNMRDLSVEVLEPRECAGIIQPRPGLTIGKGNGWIVQPAKPFPAGRPVHLRCTWKGGEESSFVFYLGPEGSFASGINTAWYPLSDHGLGLGKLRITVPPGLIVHANGLRRGSGSERSSGLFEYENTSPSYFAFVAGNYTVVRDDGAIPVSVYLLKPRTNVDEYVKGCRKSIQVLSDEFGPYPSGEFAIVETPERQSRKAGFTGASVTSFIMVTAAFLDKPFNLAYYGHEIAHQWWGNLIRQTGTRGSMMMDEAMAQYGSLRTVETLEGPSAAEQYRRTGYPGYIDNQSGLGYLKVLAAGGDHPLSEIPPSASRSLADGKGFQIWDILSRTLGRETFRRLLHKFTRTHAFQRVTWNQFLESIEEGAGRGMQWFYEQWFERTGVPEWKLEWHQEGEMLRGEITQAPPYFRATLEVEAKSGEGQILNRSFEVDGPKTEFAMRLGFAAQTVELDPHFKIIRWTPEYRQATAKPSSNR